jgi:hypothetical protein
MIMTLALELLKKEDPEAYRKLAASGIMVAHPVTINGKSHRPDNGIGYHNTIKFFNPDKDSTHKVHAIAKNLDMNAPDPKHTKISLDTFKDRVGNDVHVIKLHGGGSEDQKAHHDAFSHLGYKTNYEHTPHISVDKATHEKIRASGAKTAHEAGIAFGHAALHQGSKVVATYHPHDSHKLAASEAQGDDLEKGVKHLATSALMGMAALAPSPTSAIHMPKAPQAIQQAAPKIALQPDLQHISMIESSGGKNKNHAMTNVGVNKGHTAGGATGLMPITIQEAVRHNPDLQKKYGHLLKMDHHAVTAAINGDSQMENDIANHHWDHLGKVFRGNKQKMAYAWRNGIKAASTADETKISTHPYVQKFIQQSSPKVAQMDKSEMPEHLFKETIALNHDLKSTHGKAVKLKGSNLERYLQDNPNLKEVVNQMHEDRLQHHFAHDPELLAHAREHGISSAYKKKKDKETV